MWRQSKSSVYKFLKRVKFSNAYSSLWAVNLIEMYNVGFFFNANSFEVHLRFYLSVYMYTYTSLLNSLRRKASFVFWWRFFWWAVISHFIFIPKPLCIVNWDTNYQYAIAFYTSFLKSRGQKCKFKFLMQTLL